MNRDDRAQTEGNHLHLVGRPADRRGDRTGCLRRPAWRGQADPPPGRDRRLAAGLPAPRGRARRGNAAHSAAAAQGNRAARRDDRGPELRGGGPRGRQRPQPAHPGVAPDPHRTADVPAAGRPGSHGRTVAGRPARAVGPGSRRPPAPGPAAAAPPVVAPPGVTTRDPAAPRPPARSGWSAAAWPGCCAHAPRRSARTGPAGWRSPGW